MPVASLPALRPCAGRLRGARFRSEMPRHQRPHRIRRTSATAQPVVDAFFIDVHYSRLRAGVVVAENFDEGTVARVAGIGDDDAEERTLLGSGAAETDS